MLTPLEEKALEIRKSIVRMALRAGSGHISSALSMVEILTLLYFDIMKINSLSVTAENDLFVLSKGHGALALYAVLAERGFIDANTLAQYHVEGGVMTSFPSEPFLPGLFFSAGGALGHGLSVACGAALACKHGGNDRRVFTVLSDGECQEGAVWEAALFAAQHQLSNLVTIIDYNKLQALGNVSDILSIEPLADKWHSFGFAAFECDGHDIPALRNCILKAFQTKKPTAIIAHTIKGKGLSFMEGQFEWHYLPLVNEHAERARRELKL